MKIKCGREAVESTYESLQGKCYFLFSGDPEKKTEEFMWIGKNNQQDKIIIRLSKQTELRKLKVYNYPLLKSTKQVAAKRLEISNGRDLIFSNKILIRI